MTVYLNIYMEIVIAGGGTAGWLTALVLSKAHPYHNITLVESKEIGIVGTGESSTGLLAALISNGYLDLGTSEKTFIEECDVTPKYGIKHKAWNKDISRHYYGPIFGTETAREGNDIVFAYTVANNKIEDIHLATEHGVHMDQNTNSFDVDPGLHAYHFNTHKFGQYCKRHCDFNVKHIIGNIDDAILDSMSGEVSSLVVDGKKIKGDFFVDATGFKKLIINKMGGKWVSYKKHLPVNAAMPFWTKYDKDEIIEPATIAWAQKAGWMWQIPTHHRKGCGYVFSEDFISFDDAHKEIEQLLGCEIEPQKQIRFDSGRQEKFWIKNCCAIGLSSTFLEPLEATSIHSQILQTLSLSAAIKPTKNATLQEKSINSYNEHFAFMYDTFRDFLVAHYICGRDDSEFWKYIATGETMTDFVKDMIEMSKYRMPGRYNFPLFQGCAGWSLWSYVLAGTGNITPEVALKELKYLNAYENAEKEYFKNKKIWTDAAKQYPNNTEWVRNFWK